MELNLQATTKEQQLIKAYLEANASEMLADKINNGTPFEKDGKTLLNKKTLDGFMKYASDEARKTAEKGANYACIGEDTVYGWAVHYFEEDSIEGTLYNEDGSQYKTQPSVAVKAPEVKIAPPKPQPKSQMSMFDLLENQSNSSISATQSKIDESAASIEKREPVQPTVKLTGSPLYQNYMDIQKKYPDCVVAYRIGDFYEVFGENAKAVAGKLDLTLTSRDCGLEERIPMIGFPYHVADLYFNKILSRGHTLAVVETNGTVRSLPQNHIDLETGEIIPEYTEEEMRKFDGDIDEYVPTMSEQGAGKVKQRAPMPTTAHEAPMSEEDADFDLSAYDAEVVAILSEMFGEELELR